jgi:thioredoxin reductase (NADPH)
MPDENPKKMKLYGRAGDSHGYELRDFLTRGDVKFDWIELNSAEKCADSGIQDFSDEQLPVCVFDDGTRLYRPELKDVLEKLGWYRAPSKSEYDLVIYGAGPAGLSAAVYGASEGLSTVLIERDMVGGQAGSSSKIENYLGFPQGITGADLAKAAREQACRFGAEILMLRHNVARELNPARKVGYLSDGNKISAKAVICSTGIKYRRLNLPNEDRLMNVGVFLGAGASEADQCNGEHIFIVGGGNSAGQAAMHFSRTASKVTMVVRGECLKNTLAQYLVERIKDSPKIEVLHFSEVTALEGDKVLESITVTDKKTGKKTEYKTHWLFLCIGGDPNTGWAEEVGVMRDSAGYLLTGVDLITNRKCPKAWPLEREPYFLETNVPGVFAAGDVRHGSVKRCASAVGEGAMAVSMVHRYLADL